MATTRDWRPARGWIVTRFLLTCSCGRIIRFPRSPAGHGPRDHGIPRWAGRRRPARLVGRAAVAEGRRRGRHPGCRGSPAACSTHGRGRLPGDPRRGWPSQLGPFRGAARPRHCAGCRGIRCPRRRLRHPGGFTTARGRRPVRRRDPVPERAAGSAPSTDSGQALRPRHPRPSARRSVGQRCSLAAALSMRRQPGGTSPADRGQLRRAHAAVTCADSGTYTPSTKRAPPSSRVMTISPPFSGRQECSRLGDDPPQDRPR